MKTKIRGPDWPEKVVLDELIQFIEYIRTTRPGLWAEAKAYAPERARLIVELLFEERVEADIIGRALAQAIPGGEETPRDRKWWRHLILEALRTVRALLEALRNKTAE